MKTPLSPTRNCSVISRRLSKHLSEARAPVKRFLALQGNDPYRVLVCTVLSARTRDQVTLRVAGELLNVAPGPVALRAVSAIRLQAIIKPCGFYRAKTLHLKSMARCLGDRFNDRVPDRLNDLLSLPGVGRKTANLVLSLGYGLAAISVDVHVHRISNRLGLVTTSKPERTESALRAVLPRRLWSGWNPGLVALGQTVCLPRAPRCGSCPVERYCKKVIATNACHGNRNSA